MLDDLDLGSIADPGTRRAVELLLNLVESLQAQLLALREENQRLTDEIARLKGEQGRPKILPNRPARSAPDHSSEPERRTHKPWQKCAKLPRLEVDRTQTVPVDPLLLPPDAYFKGYEQVVIQDLVLRRENVCLRLAKYYSPSRRRTYLAARPAGYEGQFGPGIHTLALSLCYGTLVSKEQLVAFFRDAGILISSGQVAALLVHRHARFHVEAQAAAVAGLASSPWQHLDDTPTRVAGQNHSCRTLCNPLYTFYHTTPAKERLSVIETLRLGQGLSFRSDATATAYWEAVGLSQKVRRALMRLPTGREWDRGEFEALLADQLPVIGPQQRQRVLEGAALAAYRAQGEVPVVHTLLCDDAPPYREVTEALSLCWVHEGRHYKKLCPWLAPHQKALSDFRSRFWEYYRQLLAYQQQPSLSEAEWLSAAFDELFATRTGYFALDDRIEKTRSKKAELLRVLSHPELPLHNNPAELAARRRVRKRDVSFGPRSEAGVRAWDTFQSLSATCTKLGVSFYHYLQDRITRAGRIPRLAELIDERARTLDLGRSWATSPPASF